MKRKHNTAQQQSTHPSRTHPRSLPAFLLPALPGQVLAPADQEAKLGPITHEHGCSLQLLPSLVGQPLQPHSAAATATATADASEAAADAAAEALADVGGSSRGGALIIYTSGTTGKPKGVLHTHR